MRRKKKDAGIKDWEMTRNIFSLFYDKGMIHKQSFFVSRACHTIA
jgi:hypothetical protein